MVLKLGDGENTAWLGFNDGIGGDVIIQGSLNIDVFGGGQKDDVIGHFGWKHGGYLKVNTYLGAGDDSAFINMWGDISGSADVSFYMSGGAGNDSLSTWNTFDNQDYAYGSVDVTGDSSLSIVMKGGIGEDTLGLTYAGEMDGDLYIRLEGGADADDISGEVFLQGTSHGQLDALFKGQGGNDTLNFDLHDNSGGNADILQALIDGGAGWDWGYKTGPVAKINCEPILIII
jgi:hypothetical protein